MLYFSKLKIITIYLVIIFLSFFSLLNFAEVKDNYILSKKINLGLDLQGGSYLLLEVDSKPIINQKLQFKLLQIRKHFKNNKIKYENLKLDGEKINFYISKNELEKFKEFFLNEENSMNNYYNKYRAYEMDFITSDLEIPNKSLVTINYTKYGIIELKDSSLDQSLEIVRRRIDEVGTNEPTIVKRGIDRILIELPGLDNPNRIKKLLGKTANLSFRLMVLLLCVVLDSLPEPS